MIGQSEKSEIEIEIDTRTKNLERTLTGGHHENRMMDSSNTGYYNGGYVPTENMNGGRSIPPIGPM